MIKTCHSLFPANPLLHSVPSSLPSTAWNSSDPNSVTLIQNFEVKSVSFPTLRTIVLLELLSYLNHAPDSEICYQQIWLHKNSISGALHYGSSSQTINTHFVVSVTYTLNTMSMKIIREQAVKSVHYKQLPSLNNNYCANYVFPF